jgi:DNA-directed RNA polymerase subunit F
MPEYNYEENAEFYDQAIEALGYENAFEQLEPEDKKKVAEVAEAQAILNGETGSLAGMDYLHTGSAAD